MTVCHNPAGTQKIQYTHSQIKGWIFPQPLGVEVKGAAQGIGLATPENAGGRGRNRREDLDVMLLCEAVLFLPRRILTVPLGCKGLDK